jgi:ArsR family transcriptional regulator
VICERNNVPSRRPRQTLGIHKYFVHIYGFPYIADMTPAPGALFSALANQTRLRCLMLLLDHGELCVCELTRALRLSQPHVSRHLALLREGGLVRDRREGLWVHYRIHPDLADWKLGVLREIHGGLVDRPPFSDDAAALAESPGRPGQARCA